MHLQEEQEIFEEQNNIHFPESYTSQQSERQSTTISNIMVSDASIMQFNSTLRNSENQSKSFKILPKKLHSKSSESLPQQENLSNKENISSSDNMIKEIPKKQPQQRKSVRINCTAQYNIILEDDTKHINYVFYRKNTDLQNSKQKKQQKKHKEVNDFVFVEQNEKNIKKKKTCCIPFF